MHYPLSPTSSGSLPQRLHRQRSAWRPHLKERPGNAPSMFQAFLLSLVVACISFTVTEAKMFCALRLVLKARSAYLGDLFCCSYCFGHWVAFVLVAVYPPRLFACWWPLDYFLTALFIAWLAAFQSLFLDLLMAKVGK
jgi:hypothetical protein